MTEVKYHKDMKIIKASYDDKEWKYDLKGYFLIRINKDTKEIEAGYCKQDNIILTKITGKTAIEIINTILRGGLVGSLQHAADLGIELNKAEIALKLGLDYVQDGQLKFENV